LLKGGGFPHLRRNLAIEFAAESQKLMPSDGLSDFNFSRRKLTNRLPAKSKYSAKLRKPLGGEAAEWLNAAVC